MLNVCSTTCSMHFNSNIKSEKKFQQYSDRSSDIWVDSFFKFISNWKRLHNVFFILYVQFHFDSMHSTKCSEDMFEWPSCNHMNDKWIVLRLRMWFVSRMIISVYTCSSCRLICSKSMANHMRKETHQTNHWHHQVFAHWISVCVCVCLISNHSMFVSHRKRVAFGHILIHT